MPPYPYLFEPDPWDPSRYQSMPQIPGFSGMFGELAGQIGPQMEAASQERDKIRTEQQRLINWEPSGGQMLGAAALPFLTGLVLGGGNSTGLAAGLKGGLDASGMLYKTQMAQAAKQGEFLDQEAERANRQLDLLQTRGTALDSAALQAMSNYAQGQFVGTPPADALFAEKRRLFQDEIDYRNKMDPRNQPVDDATFEQLKDIAPKAYETYLSQNERPSLSEFEAMRRAIKVDQDGQRIRQAEDRLDMSKGSLKVFGWQPSPDSNISPKTINNAVAVVQGTEKEKKIIQSIMELLKQGGNALTGDQSTALQAMIGELNIARKERTGAGAALTPTETKYYFSPMAVLLADPTRSWFEVAKQFGLSRDPMTAYKQMITAIDTSTGAYMQANGFTKTKPASPEDLQRSNEAQQLIKEAQEIRKILGR